MPRFWTGPWLGGIVLVACLTNLIPRVCIAKDSLLSVIASRLMVREVRAFEKQDQLHPPEGGGVLFIGSSSIRRWDLAASFPGKEYLNRGFGGSQVSDAIRYADRIIFPYRPRTIVIYSGENDLAFGKSAERVAGDFKTLCELIHQRLPETEIVLISVKLSPSRLQLAEDIRMVNAALAAFCEADSRRMFVDVQSAMIGPETTPRGELFVEDDLHLSAEGYDLWTSFVTEALLLVDASPNKSSRPARHRPTETAAQPKSGHRD